MRALGVVEPDAALSLEARRCASGRGELVGVLAGLLGENFGVVASDLERDQGADVAEHGIGGWFVEFGPGTDEPRPPIVNTCGLH